MKEILKSTMIQVSSKIKNAFKKRSSIKTFFEQQQKNRGVNGKETRVLLNAHLKALATKGRVENIVKKLGAENLKPRVGTDEEGDAQWQIAAKQLIYANNLYTNYLKFLVNQLTSRMKGTGREGEKIITEVKDKGAIVREILIMTTFNKAYQTVLNEISDSQEGKNAIAAIASVQALWNYYGSPLTVTGAQGLVAVKVNEEAIDAMGKYASEKLVEQVYAAADWLESKGQIEDKEAYINEYLEKIDQILAKIDESRTLNDAAKKIFADNLITMDQAGDAVDNFTTELENLITNPSFDAQTIQSLADSLKALVNEMTQVVERVESQEYRASSEIQGIRDNNAEIRKETVSLYASLACDAGVESFCD
ncbi:hypothetical protein HYV56_01395 [Candidatus Peregrinibacteria bacterium]|nr:hypothetical protein [Candidatus Peregrinibacteria bacterium]